MSIVTLPCLQVQDRTEHIQNLRDFRRVQRATRYGSRIVKSAIRQLRREGWSDFNIVDRLHCVEGWKC